MSKGVTKTIAKSLQLTSTYVQPVISPAATSAFQGLFRIMQ